MRTLKTSEKRRFWTLGVLICIATSFAFATQEEIDSEAKRLQLEAISAPLALDESIGVLDRFLQYADSLDLRAYRIQANYLLGKYHLVRLHTTRARDHFRMTAMLAEQEGDFEQQGFALDRLGITFIHDDKQDSALLCFQTSMDLYRQHGLLHRVWTPLQGISQLYQSQGEHDRAMSYAEQALRSLEGFDEPLARTILLNYITTLARGMGDGDRFAKYLDMYLLTIDPENIGENNMHLSALFHISDDPADLIPEIESAIATLSAQGTTLSLIYSWYRLGEAHAETGRHDEAIEAWKKGLELDLSMDGVGYVLVFHKALSRAYSETGMHAQAMEHLKAYYHISDSVSSIENRRRLDELQVQYESAEKEQTISQQEFALKQKTRERNILAMTGILFLGLGIAIFLVLRTRLKAQKRIARHEIEHLQQQHKLISLHAMVRGQEEERKRIAYDLHDGLGGMLSSVKHQFQKLLEKHNVVSLNGEVQRTSELIDTACGEVRRIAHNMMPHALLKMGLDAAIGDMVNIASHSTDADISYQNITGIERLDEQSEILIFRIAQELLQNAIIHSAAKSIIVQLSRHDDLLSLVVEDDGRGFNPDALPADGLGLHSVQSRVQFLNGSLDIQSSPATGTTVSIEIPVRNEHTIESQNTNPAV